MEEEIILEKYWRVTVDNLEEPWHYEDVTVNAETRGEAKSKGLDQMHHLCATKAVNLYEDPDIYFTDIKVRRDKSRDVVEYKGERMTRNRMSELLWIDSRDLEAKKLVDNNPNKMFLVWAGCYNSYWGGNHSGYASDIIFAGKYSGEEAYKIVSGSSKSRDEHVRLLPENFNDTINKEIDEHKKKIERLETCKI